MTAFVAVCLTLTAPYVFKIAKSFLIWLIGLLGWLTTGWNNDHSAGPSSSLSYVAESQVPLLSESQHVNGKPASAMEDGSDNNRDTIERISEEQGPQTVAILPAIQNRTDLRGQASSAHPDQSLADTLKDSSDSREFVWKSVKSLLHGGAKQADSPSTILIVISTVLFGLFVAQAIAGVFSAKIASDHAGLSSSKHCGIWQFNEDAGGEAADRDDWYNYQKEARASRYARTCYNSPDPTEPFSCGVFYNQSIAYTTKTHHLCPFALPELCHDGLYSAVSFDTGYIDASVIGINSPNTHKFRRTTTCSPLNMSEPYVRRSSASTNDTDYYYYYGPKHSTNYTFNTSGQPFEWLVPVYSAK